MTNVLSDFKVNDRQAFIKFIDLLRQDLVDNPASWENNKLDTFLDALGSCTEDMQGYYDNMKLNINADKPDWQTFADLFKSATMYE